jgi:multisubunit Na+/H+ antiporter MnhC subunit
MLNMIEKAPLRFLHLSEGGIATGVALFLAGFWMLLAGSEQVVILAVFLISVGFALCFVAGYYRGCGNGACTPKDW